MKATGMKATGMKATGMNCPKCGQSVPEWMVDYGDTAEEELRYTARTHSDQGDCPYVACDRAECRAMKNPVTLSELQAALEHWQSHPLMHGCSHGR